jgi:hypothetical protein
MWDIRFEIHSIKEAYLIIPQLAQSKLNISQLVVNMNYAIRHNTKTKIEERGERSFTGL